MAAHRVPSFEAVWNEFVLQARLKYLVFKRSIWLLEMTLLLVVVFLLCTTHFHPWLCWAVVVVQSWRALTEALNHRELALRFNVADRFPLFAYPS